MNMKKATIIAGAAFLSFLVIQCSPKTVGSAVTPTLYGKQEALANNSAEFLESGKELFTANCARCHKLTPPETRTADNWHKVLDKMIPKTKTTAEEGAKIRAYVIANSQ